uniref:Cytochrome c oxidase subunit 7A2, mitochondrial n=1 Tax=Dicentrarchus labrax TaxID=13489 RepID=A0A8C4I7D4_DICLA
TVKNLKVTLAAAEATRRLNTSFMVLTAVSLLQENDGIPIHLKGGTADALLYRTTMALTILGTGYVVYELVKAAFPKK